MLVEAILVHGDIGYKFCWLLPSEDQTQGTPVDWAPINKTYTSWAWINDPFATLIFCFLEQVVYTKNKLEKLVIWSEAPKSMIQVWEQFISEAFKAKILLVWAKNKNPWLCSDSQTALKSFLSLSMSFLLNKAFWDSWMKFLWWAYPVLAPVLFLVPC